MTKTDPSDDGWEGSSRNALRQLGGARRGKPAGAMLLNTMGGYHHEVHSYLQRFHTGYGP